MGSNGRPGVAVAWPAIERAWRKAEFEEIWLHFRPRGRGVGTDNVLADVEAAVAAANAVVDRAGWGAEVFAEGVSDSEAGPAVLMSRAGPEPGVRAWLDAFARQLESVGWSGRVTGAPQTHLPRWLSGEEDLGPQLTAFVAYRTLEPTRMSDQQRRAGWDVSAELTARIAAAGVRWGRFTGAEVYLRRNLHRIRTTTPDVAGPLADGVQKFGMAEVSYLASTPRRLVTVSLSFQGQGCYAVLDDALPWHDQLDRSVEAMLLLPHDTDLAFVQHSPANTISWSDVNAATPPPPHVREYHLRYNWHLVGRYTPDAHGIQILTDAHLANAHDLADWTIEPLGAGRHLVRARHLAAWYAHPDPDPYTLTKARSDFGAMILTPETVAANPAEQAP